MCSVADHFLGRRTLTFRDAVLCDSLHTTALRWTLGQSCLETGSVSEGPQVSFPPHPGHTAGQTGFLAGCSHQVRFSLTALH